MNVSQIEYPLQPAEYSFTVAAIGYFDGIHLGHQRVIGKAIAVAREKGLESSIITFHPHPRQVLRRCEEPPAFITPLPDKLALLRQIGVDLVYVIHFTSRFSQLTPAQFVREVLDPLRIRHAVVGYDFRFGRGGTGTPALLSELGDGWLSVDVIDPVLLDGVKVSSTLIRERLKEGRMEEVARYLDRPFSFRGVVIHGEQRGRKLGFPTANLRLAENYCLPGNGVYGVRVHLGEEQRFGVMNIGVRPTFHQGEERSVEIHLLDFSGDLYDLELNVEILFFIRPEQRFSGSGALMRQVETDILFAKEKFLCYTNKVHKP